MSSTSSAPLFALVVGVDSYRHFDGSGAHDLAGAVNDASAWLRLLRSGFGVPAERLRLLSSGPPSSEDPEDARGVHTAEATAAELRAGVQWLACQMAEHGGVGLFTFAGHGVALRGHRGDPEGLSLALCPTDVDTGLEGALSVEELEGVVYDCLDDRVARRVLRDLTVVADACYTTERTRHGRSLGVSVARPRRSERQLLSRVFLAGHLWETAYELTLHGRRRGAFSAAMVTMIEQWRHLGGPDGLHLDVSHGDLLFAARSMLRNLGVPQSPALVGDLANLSLLPVFWPSRATPVPHTSPVPNAQRYGEQLDPDATGFTVYTATISAPGLPAVELGRVVVIGAPPPPGTGATHHYTGIFTQPLEYWFFNAVPVGYFGVAGSQIVFKLAQRKDWSTLGTGVDDPDIEAALAAPQRLDPTSSLLSGGMFRPLSGSPVPPAQYVGTLTVGGVSTKVALRVFGVSTTDGGGNWLAVMRVGWLVAGSAAPSAALFAGASAGASVALVWNTSPLPGAGLQWYQWPPEVY